MPREGSLSPNAARIKPHAVGETSIPKVSQLNEGNTLMGDRSPKSTQKQASQKQSKANVVNEQKNALITAQQATKAKAAASKRK
jgi:hypothetical protein